MKKGFILISTLSLVTILSFLTILISKQIFNDSVSTNIYQESIKKRIELINYEKFITENLLNNSNLLRNTLPYVVDEEFGDNDFIIESNETIRQNTIVETVGKGEVEDIIILDGGDGYKVGDVDGYDYKIWNYDNEKPFNGGGLFKNKYGNEVYGSNPLGYNETYMEVSDNVCQNNACTI